MSGYFVSMSAAVASYLPGSSHIYCVWCVGAGEGDACSGVPMITPYILMYRASYVSLHAMYVATTTVTVRTLCL